MYKESKLFLWRSVVMSTFTEVEVEVFRDVFSVYKGRNFIWRYIPTTGFVWKYLATLTACTGSSASCGGPL